MTTRHSHGIAVADFAIQDINVQVERWKKTQPKICSEIVSGVYDFVTDGSHVNRLS